jgi:hypothetical protein
VPEGQRSSANLLLSSTLLEMSRDENAFRLCGQAMIFHGVPL